MTRSVAIFGSTGSVGESALDLVAQDPSRWDVRVLTAHSNWRRLAEQAKAHKASHAVIADEAHLPALRQALADTDVAVSGGRAALEDAADIAVDVMLAAIVGAAGLMPTLKAARRGGIVAIANKEALVCAGPLILDAAAKSGAHLLPVDSEHNAIFQVFDFERPESVRRIILTASGGPFRAASLDEMRRMTPAQAVAHPVWSMGAKISVDSATLMNKGLEMIEAERLFPVSEERIDVVVHPQSIVHSFVEYRDGSLLAQLGTPDMVIPIAYAMAWPDRIETPAERLSVEAMSTLTFEQPDPVRFPALRLAREALKSGGSSPVVLNAANEIAVADFLAGKIGFLDILAIVEEVLGRMTRCEADTLDSVLACDGEARRIAAELGLERAA